MIIQNHNERAVGPIYTEAILFQNTSFLCVFAEHPNKKDPKRLMKTGPFENSLEKGVF